MARPFRRDGAAALPSPALRRILPALAMLTLSACDLGPDYRRPVTEVPAEWRASSASAVASWPAPDWWRGFRSAELNSLIELARVQNLDIAATIARVRQADAQVRIAGSSLLPTLSASGRASWQQVGISRRGTAIVNTTTGVAVPASSSGASRYTDIRDYSLGLDARYEIDFWGRNRAGLEAARSNAVFTRFDQATVALTVVTNVANTWFQALALQDRLEVARRNLRDAEQTLAVIRARLEAGTANALDVAQQEALVAGQRAVIPNLRSQLEQQVIGLGILIGRPPETLVVRPDTLTRLAAPTVWPGLPSALLARRPDIAAAEAQLVSANANIKVARAAFFPSISLTGSGGYQSATLTALFGPGAVVGSVAASLLQPIFDGGNLRGQLEQQQGLYEELLANYRRAILQAFTDVENALTALRFTSEQQRLQQTAVDAAQRAADIARAQLAVGTVDVTTVLQAQITLFNQQDLLVQVRLARFLALLNLYKALGGGWSQPVGPIPDQFPGLRPGLIEGGIALPVGGNVE